MARLIDSDGVQIEAFPRGAGYPDTRSYRLELGVLVPATNSRTDTVLRKAWLGDHDGEASRRSAASSAAAATASTAPVPKATAAPRHS